MKNDLISRQTAINAKQEFRNPNVIRDTESRTAYDRTYANGWNDCNKAWINAIEKLPSIQPNKGYIEQINWELDMAIQQLKKLRYGLGEKIRTDEDTISRQAAIYAVEESRRLNHHQDGKEAWAHEYEHRHFLKILKDLPSAQPFHNITMNDVLKYIDDMPEDVWQEFTACLECRGWELQRRTAKWCGGEFA